MMDNLNGTFLGNSIHNWIIALAVLAASMAGIFILRRIILQQLRKWTARTSTTIDDFLVGTLETLVLPLLYVAAVYFAVDSLTIPATISRILHVAFLFVLTFFVLRIVTAVIRQFVFSFIHKQENSETKEKQAKGLLIITNVAIWILGIVFLIDNLGYDVTTLVAGLGIGGIAIALAAQTILGDLFSYFVIFFDRPFEIGDFIVVEDKMGVVEYVGIKTTRIRTLGGEQLICSNTYLTNARVHNYKRMEQRRVVFKIGVLYQTTPEQLQHIPGIVKAIVESKDSVRFDRGHFSGFGDSSLDFEFVFYVHSPDYNFYMDRQQEIFLDIVLKFGQHGIGFAYPTRTLFIEQPEPAGSAN
jgi:small-conductance mechanosensitive channel